MGTMTYVSSAGTLKADYTVTAGITRKSGPGYVRYEDLVGATFIAKLKSLTSPAVVTLPEGLFELPAFSQGGNLYGLILQGNLKGLSGSGPGTIVQMAVNTISQASINYSNGLTSANVSLLMAIITGDKFDGPELSQLHLRGTEQKGIYHYPMQWQRSTNGIFHDVLVSGFPGGNPVPPTEAGGVQIKNATFARIGQVEIDGRRYDQTTNLPGTKVSSSLLMINSVGDNSAKLATPLLTLPNFYLHDGLYGPIAMWHSTNIKFTNPRLTGTINHEESGWIEYVNAQMTPTGNFHYQTTNDTGDTTFTDSTWVPVTGQLQPNAGSKFVAMLLDNTTPVARTPIVRNAGVPQQIYLGKKSTSSWTTVTSS